MTKEEYTPQQNSKVEKRASKSIPMDRIMIKSDHEPRINVDINEFKPFFEPSLTCFCKKPVYRYHTLEYGPILECAKYDKSSPYYNPKFVCGFHAHEFSWLKVIQHVSAGYPIYAGYRELETCPLYNFTFCGLFKVDNEYSKCSITMPTCFCNRVTQMAYEKEGRRKVHEAQRTVNYVSCSNRNVPGAPKCNYFNSSDVTVFARSKHQAHTAVEEQEYIDALALVEQQMNLKAKYKYLGHTCLFV